MKIKKIGEGEFGTIYEGLINKEAVDFLISKKNGEIKGAFYHSQIGYIDLIWGKSGEKGYGLAKIIEKHPEAIEFLTESICRGKIIDKIPDRIIIINKDNNQRSIIDLQFNNRLKSWVVTSYIPL